MKKRKGRERKNKVAHPQHTPTQALSPETTVPPHPAPQPSSQEPQPTPPQQPAMPFAEEMQMLRQQLEDRLQQQQREQQQQQQEQQQQLEDRLQQQQREQQQQQREQQQQLQKQQLKTAILIKPRVRNAAACILKVAVGVEQFRDPSTSSHVNSSTVRGHLSSLTGLKVRDLDKVITRRNEDTHPSTLAKLDEEVRELSVFLPDLEKASRHECKVLASYDSIKAAIPQNFK